MSGRVLLLGSTDLSVAVARHLHACGVTVAGIMSTEPKFEINYRTGGMTNSRHADMAAVASEVSAKYRAYEGVKSISAFAHDVDASLMIAAGWHHMVPRRVRAVFDMPCLGLHASLLPSYRGGAPLNWALINGDAEAGVSIFELADGVDDGPLYGQSRFPIAEDDDIGDLVRKAQEAFLGLLEEVVPGVLSGERAPYPQDGEPSYSLQRFPEDGRIDWNWPAARIERLVRATTRPYPGAFAQFNGETIRLWRVTAVKTPTIFGIPGQIACLKSQPYPIIVTGHGLLAVQEASLEDGRDAVELLRTCHNRKIGVESK